MPNGKKKYCVLVFPQPHPLPFGLFLPPVVNILRVITMNSRHNRGSVDRLPQDISQKLYDACRMNSKN